MSTGIYVKALKGHGVKVHAVSAGGWQYCGAGKCTLMNRKYIPAEVAAAIEEAANAGKRITNQWHIPLKVCSEGEKYYLDSI